MHTYIYIYVCTCTRTYTYMCAYSYLYTHICARTAILSECDIMQMGYACSACVPACHSNLRNLAQEDSITVRIVIQYAAILMHTNSLITRTHTHARTRAYDGRSHIHANAYIQFTHTCVHTRTRKCKRTHIHTHHGVPCHPTPQHPAR